MFHSRNHALCCNLAIIHVQGGLTHQERSFHYLFTKLAQYQTAFSTFTSIPLDQSSSLSTEVSRSEKFLYAVDSSYHKESQLTGEERRSDHGELSPKQHVFITLFPVMAKQTSQRRSRKIFKSQRFRKTWKNHIFQTWQRHYTHYCRNISGQLIFPNGWEECTKSHSCIQSSYGQLGLMEQADAVFYRSMTPCSIAHALEGSLTLRCIWAETAGLTHVFYF